MRFRRRTVAATAAALTGGAVAAVLLTARGAPPRTPTPAELHELPACQGTAALHSTVRGAPLDVLPGDGWHELTATLTNTTHRKLPVVFVAAYTWRQTLGDGDPQLTPYARLQLWSPSAHRWTDAPNDADHAIDVIRGLHGGGQRSYRLRFAVLPTAPRGLDYGDVALDMNYTDTGPGAGGRIRPCRQEAVGDAGFGVHPSADAPTVTPSGG